MPELTLELNGRQFELIERLDDLFGSSPEEKARTALSHWMATHLEKKLLKIEADGGSSVV